MKKFLITIGLLAFCTSQAFCAESCNCVKENSTISVSANASKEVVPDTVEINIEIQTNDTKSMQTALTKNNEISDKVLNGLLLNIDKTQGDYLKTSYFRADTLYKYENSKRYFDKYQVTNTVIVHTSSIKKVPEIIEKSIELGATGISNLNFSVSNYEEYQEELLTKAISKAKKRANVAAKNANTELCGVKTINIIGDDTPYARVHNTAVNFKALGRAATETSALAPTIEPGIIKIQMGVNMVYNIKNLK